MFSLLFLIFPLIISFLFLSVFKKAGFEGGFLILCFAPLLGAVLPMGMIFVMQTGMLDMMFSSVQFDFAGPILMIISLIGSLLGMLPVIILAFMDWPVLER